MSTRRRTDLVEAILEGRRPDWSSGDVDVDADAASASDADTLRAVIVLAGGRPGAALVRPQFVADLAHLLAREPGDADHARGHPAFGRRRLLTAVGMAAAAAAGTEVVDRLRPAVHAVSPLATGEANIADGGQWQVVATTSELAAVGVVRFATEATVGFVATSGGVLRAVSGVCTHQGCLLAYRPQEQDLACPCHRATFTLAGDVDAHDVDGVLPPLPRLPVRARDGRIEVYLPAGPRRAPDPKRLET
jgi:nitrite reductase/ring-hydroxylating ferredoxin subunit